MVKGLFLFVVAFLLTAQSWAFGPLVSFSAREGVLTFRATIFVPEGYDRNFRDLVAYQTKHLLSVFETKQFNKLNDLPYNDELGSTALGSLIDVKILNSISVQGGTEVTYLATHRILVRKDVMGPDSKRAIHMVLPHDPIDFYSRACTDELYYEKQYLFYFWNPYTPACLAKQIGQNQVDQVTAEIQTFSDNPSLETVTPDYAALARQIQAHGELRIAMLFGIDEKSTDPNDNGRKSFNVFENFFESSGFETVRKQNTPTAPFAEYFKPADSTHYAVRIYISLSVSDQNSPVVFSRRARAAFETADIVEYEGHSGLGGNLDLAQVTKLSSPDPENPVPIKFPNQYQIYFFDSCASFFFYYPEYGMNSQGPRHVDMIANGVASYFYTQNRGVARFLNAFLEPDTNLTWAQILANMETSHPTFTYLLNVSLGR
jgi:hypothetical protein